MRAHDLQLSYYDPYVSDTALNFEIERVDWPQGLSNVDYVIFTAPLTKATFHLFGPKALAAAKPGLRLVNVGRGPLVCEETLVKGLELGLIDQAALDVFESEPYNPITHPSLHAFRDRLILGSHNGSNTREAVTKVSLQTIRRLKYFLDQVT